MFSQMLFLLVTKMEILFYSVTFCPSKSITNSFNFAHSTFLVFVAGNKRWAGGNFIQISKINEELQRRGVLLDLIISFS